MIKGISLGETELYVSKLDTGDNPTKWKIGVLDSAAMAEIRDMVTVFEVDRQADANAPTKNKLCLNQVNLEAVRFGLKGFENFIDSRGSMVDFMKEKRALAGKHVEVVNEDILRMIPFDVLMELGEVILKKNKISAEEAKN
jgi:hypothetical protein